MPDRRYAPRTIATVSIALLIVVSGIVGAGFLPAFAPSAQDESENVTEPAYEEPAPEPGDPYFEAEADDGRWVSYVNPRDEYRSPYLGDGSGKICVTLLNEAGDPIVGETVPDTSVTIPTGESIDWHSHADPVTVRFPMTEHYERPLDADQFGTSDDLPQGDGYMDSHCIEIHGLPEDGGTVEYGPAQVDGTHADRIDVVGYVQVQDTWDSAVDPIDAAEPYDQAGGGWTYEPESSHAQVVVVLQLDPPNDDGGDETDDSGDDRSDERTDDGSDGDGDEQHDGDDGSDGNDGDDGDDGNDGDDDNGEEDGDGDDDVDGDEDGDGAGGEGEREDGNESDNQSTEGDDEDRSSGTPGFGVVVALAALAVAALAIRRR